jgi:hypothetical protein
MSNMPVVVTIALSFSTLPIISSKNILNLLKHFKNANEGGGPG